jgi:nicotinamide-nucleotide amidase
VRAEILSVGTELLLGQIVDTNSAYLAGRLAGAGVDCLHMTTVGDNLERAVEAIQRGLGRSELLVLTGGLGPTEDDLTREAIAAAVGETPAVDERLAGELAQWFTARGAPMPERNLKQAWLIPSARALPNPNGTAPGWDVRRGGKRIVAMPGVPREMAPMWEDHVEPTLFAGAVLRSRTLKLLGMGESAVEEALGDLVRSRAPTVATYAKNDGVHIRLTDKDPDEATVARRLAEMERRVRERIGAHVWGTDGETLGSVVDSALHARGWRLATAEALSGGELAQSLAGAGVRAYAGGIVRPGADAAALASAIEAIGAEVSVLVPAGIAETQVVVRTPERERTATVHFRSDSEGRRRSVLAALDLLRRALL